MSLTKTLRWDIQALGQRLSNAANAEEISRRGSSEVKTRVQNDIELKLIIQDIRNLLNRIEDAVPLINLAITTSGASLSTNLPASISPSRLLQASTFLTAGDTQYSMLSSQAVQIGPTFILSMYMLFSGHIRPQDEQDLRETTWKEVIHKARVKLLRVPLDVAYNLPGTSKEEKDEPCTNGHTPSSPYSPSTANQEYESLRISGGAYADEFAYQLLIVEDLDDDRVHTFEDNEIQPGPFEEVELAGLREVVPVHQVSKIFYADTGKILNIGNEGEANSPVLLLKRDLNAMPPRRMMERFRTEEPWDDEEDENAGAPVDESVSYDDSHQSEVDAQLFREHRSSSFVPSTDPEEEKSHATDPWRLPAGLDPEWMAFEVYTESNNSDTESNSEAEAPSTHPTKPSREPSLDPQITTALSNLRFDSSSPSPQQNQLIPQSPMPLITSAPSPFTNIRTSLSLLETLVRLCSLQQFQQTSHLAINDELLNFFLEESSTTGAGGDGEERKRVRREARARVGFDPYDESPVKRRGEEYQYQDHGGGSRQGSEAPWDPQQQYAREGYASPRWEEGYDDAWGPRSSMSRDRTPETPPLLLKDHRSSSSRGATPDRPIPPGLGPRGYSSPPTPSGMTKGRQAVLRRDTAPKKGSPLGRPRTGLTDEGLGTSPGFHRDTVLPSRET